MTPCHRLIGFAVALALLTIVGATCSLSAGNLWQRGLLHSTEDDYSAEDVCPSPSPVNGGRGCSRCFAPRVMVETWDIAGDGWDLGSHGEVQLAFERLGGRHLQLNLVGPIQVWWGLRGLNSTAKLTDHTAATRDFGPDTSAGGAYVTTEGFLDSGPLSSVTGLEMVRTAAVLRSLLPRPLGAQVLFGLRFSIDYVIAGCRQGLHGQGSIAMSLRLRPAGYNTSACRSDGSCNATCAAGFTGIADMMCKANASRFEFHGCRAGCASPVGYDGLLRPNGTANAQDTVCAEGPFIPHGSACRGQCDVGYSAHPQVLQCLDGRLEPESVECIRDCVAPPLGEHMLSVPCEELQTVVGLRHLGNCTPLCALGYRPNVTKPLTCISSVLTPSTFSCMPLLLLVGRLEVVGTVHAVALALPSLVGSSSSSRFVATVSSDLGGRGVRLHPLPRNVAANGSDPDLRVVAQAPFAGERMLAVVATHPLNAPVPLLVVVRDRYAGGFGGPSPVLRITHWMEERVSLESLLELPIAGCACLAVVAGLSPTVLVVAFPSGAAEDASVFAWNGTGFVLMQHMRIFAWDVASFVVAGRSFVAFAGDDGALAVYRWDPITRKLLASMAPSVATPPMSSAVAWLGCKDDTAFMAPSNKTCSQLSSAECRDDEVQLACGWLCGCAHGEALLAVATSASQGESLVLIYIAIVNESSGNLSFTLLSESRVLGLVRALSAMYVPTHRELYVAVAVGGAEVADGATTSAGTGLYRVKRRGAGGISLAQALGRAAAACIAMPGLQVSFVMFSTDVYVSGVNWRSLSTLFLSEGGFSWQASVWSTCNLPCRVRGPEVSLRSRVVNCTALPSGTVYSNDMCGHSPKPPSVEECLVPLCQVALYTWHIGIWSACMGDCGYGTQVRTVQCMPQNETGAPDEAGARCADVERPTDKRECMLRPCLSYRLVNRAVILLNWRVYEVGFFADEACTQAVVGDPIASGTCGSCVCSAADGSSGQCNAELAFDGSVPNVSTKVQGTAWVSQCGDGQQCMPSQAWLGLQVYQNVPVRCVKLLQIGDGSHMTGEVALEAFSFGGSIWQVVTEWSNVPGGAWTSLLIPRLCSNDFDCNSHGVSQGLPGSCRCLCQPPYSGDKCEMCAAGYLNYPECSKRVAGSTGWRLVVTSSIAGNAWHVGQLSLHTSVTCSQASAIGAGLIINYTASDWGLSPARALDANGSATAWVGMCGSGGCEASDVWIGVFLQASSPLEVTCMRLSQPNPHFAADSVALEFWVGPGKETGAGRWVRVREWLALSLSAVFGENVLRVVCDGGITEDANVMHRCFTGLRPWEECTVSCQMGYSGSPARFVCLDTYTFAGVMPVCTPSECIAGIPVFSAVSSTSCLRLLTKQKCTAKCMAGFVGDPVSYTCGPDGALRDDTFGKVGLRPLCTRTETIKGELSAAWHRSCSLLSAAAAVAIGLL